MSRNTTTLTTLLLASLALAGAGCNSGSDVGEGRAITAMITPTCECCKGWIRHLEDNGFRVTTQVLTGDVINGVRRDNNIGMEIASCHLAKAGDYWVEGHVPADVVAQLLNEQPDVAGISVPGMPGGSPGMESQPKEPYRVVTFDGDGQILAVYARR